MQTLWSQCLAILCTVHELNEHKTSATTAWWMLYEEVIWCKEKEGCSKPLLKACLYLRDVQTAWTQNTPLMTQQFKHHAYLKHYTDVCLKQTKQASLCCCEMFLFHIIWLYTFRWIFMIICIINYRFRSGIRGISVFVYSSTQWFLKYFGVDSIWNHKLTEMLLKPQQD